MRNLRVFYIGANVAALALEVVSLRMSGFCLGGLPSEVPILVETILSLKETMINRRDDYQLFSMVYVTSP